MKTEPKWPQHDAVKMASMHMQPDAIAGVLHIRTLDDAPLLDAARRPDGAAHRAIREHMGAKTNPNWITARCADEAYDRDLIDEHEYDHLVS